MGTTLLIAILVVGIAVLLLSIGLILGKKKEFPSGHVDDSQALQEKGIKCAKEQMNDDYNRKDLQDRILERNSQ